LVTKARDEAERREAEVEALAVLAEVEAAGTKAAAIIGRADKEMPAGTLLTFGGRVGTYASFKVCASFIHV
jgi:hypothetical protein